MKYFVLPLLMLGALAGCASYTTPGGSAPLSELADNDINDMMSKQPAANFPANIAIARIQATGYQNYKQASFGHGRYSVMTTREAETDADIERLNAMPDVRGVAPINKILLPTQLDSIKDLRQAAARLRADVLLIYTFDTSFHAGEQKFAPLNTIALGFLKNKDVSVTTTATAALFDVRTEFLYGIAEATARESKSASVWSTTDAVDDMRVVTEKAAFNDLVPAIEKAWQGIVREHKGR